MPDTLPHPNTLITSLITQLTSIAPKSADTPSIPLSSLRRAEHKAAKAIFTTLHFLFPHELLPALDILDRKLVTQLVVVTGIDTNNNTTQSPSTTTTNTTTTDDPTREILYVQSASATTTTTTTSKSRSKYRRVYNPAGTHYAVHVSAWNCTCPAFAFSAFGTSLDLDADNDANNEDEDDDDSDGGDSNSEHVDWRFGGTLTRDGAGARGASVPVCKHILAAVLGKVVPGLFGDGVVRREVSAVEAAGWAGGWGD